MQMNSLNINSVKIQIALHNLVAFALLSIANTTHAIER